MNTSKMLKDLLERVESGEVVIINFDVSNESVELDSEFGSSAPPETTLTGEQVFYITTKPGKKRAPSEVFNNAVSRLGKTADWLSKTGYGPAKVWPDLTQAQKERLTALEGELAANESCFVFNPAGNSWRVAVYKSILKRAEELQDEIDCRTKGYAQVTRIISRLKWKIEAHKNG